MKHADPTSVTDRLSRLATPGPSDPAGSTSKKLATLRGVRTVPTAADDRSLPNRYQIREREDGQVLLCGEAPGVTVLLDRSFAFSEAEARKLGERTILLDGAGQFSPLVDDSAHLYNLDHHQDCLRAFTLASCEQSLVLVLKGLRLDKGDWTIYANEPDLDTVFALWVLLNYRRVRHLSTAQRDAILPMLRLEGAIDANGFQIAEHCGLPQDLLEREKARLDSLHHLELEAKRQGRWDSELIEYTLEMLLAIDRLVYKASDFDDYSSVDTVFCHVEIGNDNVAVVCRDEAGIYEVEKRLKGIWGDRLGLIALQKEEGHYTLRRSAGLSGIELADAYDKFNLLDPAVDGRPPEKRWGGSDDIGGSPRPGGSQLTPREVGNVLKLTYQSTRSLQHLQRILSALLWGFGLCLAASVGVFGWRVLTDDASASAEGYAVELLLAGGLLAAASWLMTRRLSSGWTWLFGWRRAAGEDWLALVPLVILGGVLGGAWTPPEVAASGRPLWIAALAISLMALALELCFHGLLHGLLILDYRVQGVRSRWFVSVPVATTAILYTVTTALVMWIWPRSGGTLAASLEPLAWSAGGALLASLGTGMIRERSLSVWPSVVTLIVAGLSRLAFLLW